MYLIIHHKPTIDATRHMHAGLGRLIARIGRAWERATRPSSGLPRAAAELFARADAYESTQPGYAADLREAARSIAAGG